MRLQIAVILFFFLIQCNHDNADNKHGRTSLFQACKGLILAGYQDWFHAEGGFCSGN